MNKDVLFDEIKFKFKCGLTSGWSCFSINIYNNQNKMKVKKEEKKKERNQKEYFEKTEEIEENQKS